MSAVPTFEWFPASLEEVSPEWITSVLRANGIDVEVESFSGKKFGTGQLGYMVRATLEYRGGRPPNAPETLIFKLPSSDPTSKGTGVQVSFINYSMPHSDLL